MILSYLRTVVLYLVLILVIRLMGKRQIGEMEPTEFVVAMLISDLATIPMQDEGTPLYSGLVPILTVLAMELVLSALVLRSMKLRRWLCGKPVILIENGKILRENLRKTRVSLDELSGHLREKDVLDISAVQYAILETNGNISVFVYPREKPANAAEAGISVKKQFLPVTIIGDGYLFQENLRRAGKDGAWVREILKERGATQADTWLLTVDAGENVVWYGKESEK